MKPLTEEEITNLRNLAEALLTDEQIADVLELSYAEFLQLMEDSSEVNKALKAGRLLTVAKVNKSIIEAAEQGSSPAQAMVKKMVDNLTNRDQL